MAIDNHVPLDNEAFNQFLKDPVHEALAACSAMRPSVDISVGGDNSTVGVGAGGARTEYSSKKAADFGVLVA